jgi:hypothetical protein
MTKKDITLALVEKLLELRNSLCINQEQNELLTKIANYMRYMQAEIDTTKEVKQEKIKRSKKKVIDEPAGYKFSSDVFYKILEEQEHDN